MPRFLVFLAAIILVIAAFEAPNLKLEDSLGTFRQELEQLKREMDNTPQRTIYGIPNEVREVGQVPAFQEFDRHTLTSGTVMFWNDEGPEWRY